MKTQTILPIIILSSLALGQTLTGAVADNQLDNSITITVPLPGMVAVVKTTQIELDSCVANLKVAPSDVAVSGFALLECLKNKDFDGDGEVLGRK